MNRCEHVRPWPRSLVSKICRAWLRQLEEVMRFTSSSVPSCNQLLNFLDVKYLMCFTYLCVTWISLFVFGENGNAFNSPAFAFPSIYINKTHQTMGHFSNCKFLCCLKKCPQWNFHLLKIWMIFLLLLRTMFWSGYRYFTTTNLRWSFTRRELFIDSDVLSWTLVFSRKRLDCWTLCCVKLSYDEMDDNIIWMMIQLVAIIRNLFSI